MSGILQRLKNLFSPAEKEDGQLDLFRHAENQEEAKREPRKSRGFLLAFLLLLFGSILLFGLGYYTGSRQCALSDQEEPAETKEEARVDDASKKPLPDDAKRFLGFYLVETGGHKAELYIYDTGLGYAAGTIRFTNWGRHVPEYTIGLTLSGNQLYFLRSCEGRRCSEIGSTSPIRQEYFGMLTPDALKIEGNYKGNQSSGIWTAVRIR